MEDSGKPERHIFLYKHSLDEGMFQFKKMKQVAMSLHIYACLNRRSSGTNISTPLEPLESLNMHILSVTVEASDVFVLEVVSEHTLGKL